MNGKREASCTYLINIRTGHLESFLVNDNEDSAVQNWVKKDILPNEQDKVYNGLRDILFDENYQIKDYKQY